MNNLIKLSNRKLITNIIITLILVTNCNEDKQKEIYAVKVKDSTLSLNEMHESLGSEKYNKKYQEEFILDWARTEVLYQEAVSEGIVSGPEYNRLIDQSKKELAAALLLNKFFLKYKISAESSELEKFFHDYKDDYRVPDHAYILNIISFSDEIKAILFRSTLIESDWTKTLIAFDNDTSIVKMEKEEFLYLYQLLPLNLLRTVKELPPNEVSIVIETEPKVYTIVQLVEIIMKGEVPKYMYVKDLVRERFLIMKRKNLVNSYVEELYSKYKVVINKDIR